MILSIAFILLGVFGSNFESTSGDGIADTDLGLLRDSVAFYPIPQLTIQNNNASTIYKDNSKLLQGNMDVYSDNPNFKKGGQGGVSFLGSNDALYYYPTDRFLKRRYNISGKFPQEPSQYINKMDAMWFKSLRNAFTEVVQNRYFFIPHRKIYNTTITKPKMINPFIDIFNRNKTSE